MINLVIMMLKIIVKKVIKAIVMMRVRIRMNKMMKVIVIEVFKYASKASVSKSKGRDGKKKIQINYKALDIKM